MTRTNVHSDYPHEPGMLYGCPVCESACHCQPGQVECVYDGPHNGQAAPGDESSVLAECRAAQAAGEEISDGCARTIAAMYADGPMAQSFASTGAITSPDSLWWELFGGETESGLAFYFGMRYRIVADMLGTYLTAAGVRGPVAGWSQLWVR